MTTTVKDPAQQDSAEAWARLRRLRDQKELIGSFPEVCSLIGRMDEEKRARSGQLLTTLSPDSLLAAHPRMTAVTVVVTGNGTCAPLVAPLTAEFARHRMVLRTAGHGQYLADLGDPGGPAYDEGTDITLCLLDADAVTAELGDVWTVEDCERTLHALSARLRGLAQEHDRAGSGTLVLNTLPLPSWLARQLIDYRSRARLGLAWREFNSSLLRLGLDLRRCVVIDLDTRLTDATPLDEPRLRTYAKVGFSEALLRALAQEAASIAKSLRGLGRKCLVLDLDGTLWGGILGDDGTHGIEIGSPGRGEAFTRFQRLVAQLGSQGVLLALCSKNDEDAVRAALRENPEMTLREKDFVAVRANWEPKDRNIAELAEQLNIGTDSMVFVDDSAFEAGLVRESLPEVAVVELDGEPAQHPSRLLADDWFAVLQLTAEDYTRREKYQAETERDSFRTGFSSLRDYLAELEIRVTITHPEAHEAGRIAQMTQRTNQFNMTTVRMDAAQVEEYACGPDTAVWAVRSADRFGDHGIVGALFVRTGPEGVLTIENTLLSCRVFSRGIESACLRALLEHAADSGATAVTAHYRPTAKNHRFADFYQRHGFVPHGSDGQTRHWRHALTPLPDPVGHITLTPLPQGATT
ncbi:HAD-IIIC family phosphatase [Streptomyces sp. G5(2025)]|uniref:HAD-IIIC family phosphatase n=1 Tax=Streptomyces sp. G5(2025) TaxID=3406628 RepID=UPI003C24AC35